MQELKPAIEKFDVISFDVFDTLLLRQYLTQEDLRRFGRATGTRTRSAADYSITETLSVVPDPLESWSALKSQ